MDPHHLFLEKTGDRTRNKKKKCQLFCLLGSIDPYDAIILRKPKPN